MKVKELREQIADLKDDADILFLMNSGCCGDHETMSAYDSDSHADSLLLIYFDALPGYQSCIHASNTKKMQIK